MKKIKVLYHNSKLEPIEKISVGDWIDLRLSEDVTMKAGDYRLLSLGVSIKLPRGYEAIVAPRSSTFSKYGIIMANSLGIIDETYCGIGDIWRFPAYATRNVTIPMNTRICQFRIVKHQPKLKIMSVKTLHDENRGGLGSTGTN